MGMDMADVHECIGNPLKLRILMLLARNGPMTAKTILQETGASQTTGNIFKSWCRMLGGQFFLLLMNAWCLRLFTSMVGTFLANPLSL